jgi:hypothetical protein
MTARTRRLSAVALLVAVCVTGCTSGRADEPGVADDPASVVAIDGPGAVHRIQLTADAAQRIGLLTETVRALPVDSTNGGSPLGVAASAVVYDETGATWVYVETEPLTFQRVQVVVTRVSADTALLRSGPAVGTQVVTVGVAELRGSEYGVPGE